MVHSYQIPYQIKVIPLFGYAEARLGEQLIAASDNARLMHETRLPPTVYFPLDSVRTELLKPSKLRTFCPFKGTAVYWDVLDQANAAWSYPNALTESQEIEGYIGFQASEQLQIDSAGASSDAEFGGYLAGPLLDWLLREAWQCQDPAELTRQFAEKLVENGVAVYRMNALIWSLHPQIAGASYLWRQDQDEIQISAPSHDTLLQPKFHNSPLRYVSEGLGGVRQPLNSRHHEFDFPIMHDLEAEGATDYVAMPLPFSSGKINVLTLTSKHPKGFTTANLGLIFECSTMLSRFYEVFALRRNTASLLETYLGKRTGSRVLGGDIRRGDGEAIEAAILFCDLRGSSKWAERLSRDDYLALLNAFFELTTDAVNRAEGEVLKFIGDAVLAIFPGRGDKTRACQASLKAAQAIMANIPTIQPQLSQAAPNIACSLGIAYGMVNYGNVGSNERLDFTVTGTPAVIAARLSDLGKRLGQTTLVSSEIADSVEATTPLVHLGQHPLRNVSKPQTLYALATPVSHAVG